MRLLVVSVCLGVLSACSPAPKPVETVVANEPPQDEMRRFPEAGQIKMEMVPDHLLGYSFLPGGNLATYHVGKLNYRQFLAHLKTSDDSPGVLVGVRKALENPQYLAHMGGYYGTDHGRPVYLFVKGPWVAGVEGLPEPKADEIARQFALHF